MNSDIDKIINDNFSDKTSADLFEKQHAVQTNLELFTGSKNSCVYFAQDCGTKSIYELVVPEQKWYKSLCPSDFYQEKVPTLNIYRLAKNPIMNNFLARHITSFNYFLQGELLRFICERSVRMLADYNWHNFYNGMQKAKSVEDWLGKNGLLFEKQSVSLNFLENNSRCVDTHFGSSWGSAFSDGIWALNLNIKKTLHSMDCEISVNFNS